MPTADEMQTVKGTRESGHISRAIPGSPVAFEDQRAK